MLGAGLLPLLPLLWFFYHDYQRYAAYFPQCFWYETTGLYCPGCGLTRALHAALHGEWFTALHMNAFFWLITLPLAVLGLLEIMLDRLFISLKAHARLVWCYLVLALIFTVLRNLPWMPWHWLAPPSL